MIGAIIGDITGSRFERFNHRSKSFKMFHHKCKPTDDSVMTLAIAKALLESDLSTEDVSEHAIQCMSELGKSYPNAGYGKQFIQWIQSNTHTPYNSYGNGAAMRVSPVAYAAASIEEVKVLSRAVTEVTHNHPEGIKGAESVAVAVYMALHNSSKDDIYKIISDQYYKLDFDIKRIKFTYKFDMSCQGSVPQAINAFLQSDGFEDAIRCAISIGGDSDTIAAITGSIAGAFYGVPNEIYNGAISYLDNTQRSILHEFENKYL